MMMGNCCQITPDSPGQAGSVFYNEAYNLNQSFSLDVILNFGCKDGNGADGIVFVLAQSSTALGGGGGLIGYQGISNSVAIEIDDYQNGNYGDPSQDHMAIISNGSVNHNQNTNLSGPSIISNIEDCFDHCFSVEWNPNIPVFRARLDNNIIEYFGDIRLLVGQTAFFGFTSGTGSLSNIHKVCFNQNPDFTPMADVSICEGDSVTLQADPDGSAWSWSSHPTLSNTEISNPVATPTSTTTYTVTITYGCSEVVDDVRVTVLPNPDISVSSNHPVCEGEYLSLYAEGGTFYQWTGPGQFASSLPLAEFNPATSENGGLYTLRVTGPNGCSSDTSIFVEVYPVTPAEILDTLNIVCYNTPGFYIGAYPPGGEWSGSISNDGYIDPVAIGSGMHQMIYAFTNEYGCNTSAADSFYIPAVPELNIATGEPLCAVTMDTSIVEITVFGDGPFNILLQQGIQWIDRSTDLTGRLELPITTAGVYNIYEIEDAFGCRYSLSDSFEVTTFNPPDIKNIEIDCSPDITYYTVTLQIEADSSAGYLFSGTGGILKQIGQDSFLIDSIASGSTFLYALTNIYACGEKQLQDSVTCVCTEDAGSLPLDTIKICTGEQIITQYLGGETITEADTILFVLHDGNLDSLGKIISVSDIPAFSSEGLRVNTFYYLHAVAGKKRFFSTGSFSFPCIDLSNGQPVIILPAVQFDMTSDRTDVCPGEEVQIGITILGTEKYTFNLLGGNTNQIIETTQSPYFFTFTPAQSSIVFATLLDDSYALRCAKNIRDSVIVQMLPEYTSEKNINLCFGDSLKIAGKYEKNSGRFEEKFTAINGCDSTIFYNITILKQDTTYQYKNTCKENESGIFTDTYQNIRGCDSIIIHVVNFMPAEIIMKEEKSCISSLPDTIILTNQLGCDSLIVTNYIFLPPDTVTTNQSACQSFYWETSNQAYTNSGLYEVMLKNRAGCDSLVQLNLTINPNQITQDNISACDSFYIDQERGFLYDSGEITDTSSNIFGCDSIHLTRVQIYPSYYFEQNINSCKSYYWSPGKKNLTESGYYEFTLETSRGCDSIYAINLAIEEPVEIRDTVISGLPYTWAVNGIVYQESGIYNYINTAENGCDSIFILYFTRALSGDIFIGNIFKPGNSGNNRTIYISASESIPQIEKFSIFDRWGNRVFNREFFQPNLPEEGWDGTFNGKNVASDVYTYLIIWKGSNHKTEIKTGDITVLRE